MLVLLVVPWREGLAYTRQFNLFVEKGGSLEPIEPRWLRAWESKALVSYVTPARQYRRKTKSSRQSRSANIFLQGIIALLKKNPSAPVKYCSVIFIHSRVKQLFVINSILQLYCKFILRLAIRATDACSWNTRSESAEHIVYSFSKLRRRYAISKLGTQSGNW